MSKPEKKMLDFSRLNELSVLGYELHTHGPVTTYMFQPGDGTRYRFVFVEYSEAMAKENGWPAGGCLVGLHASLAAASYMMHPVGPWGVLVESYVKEKWGYHGSTMRMFAAVVNLAVKCDSDAKPHDLGLEIIEYETRRNAP